ncbi:hypothetical protein DXV75_16795 [Alteromonas aestuariivivens]|uniref:DUF4304 domain-containing protein n=1 Tax=Alteromonas aestuariivivens TaxID=1938339 RepID=A0A3D8M2P7_9ALTE|nr:hypothetical protein [Alteromonas aestuariivivens]RDV23898.1 hypothetical protein DXV75_16795 [Alteromonas aestuariivivens]
MKSKLIKEMKQNGYIETSSDGSMFRLLKPSENDFSLGFLIGKAGKENLISIQWGVVHTPMWELQQEVENLKELNLQFLLFSNSVHLGFKANINETSLEAKAVLMSLQSRIEFMESQENIILEDTSNSLASFITPTVFSYDKHLLNEGMAHYYGLLFKHLRSGISVQEINLHIKTLLASGISERSPPIYKMHLLSSYVGS